MYEAAMAFCKMSEVTFRLREAIVFGAVAFITGQSVSSTRNW